ncbi:MAG: hypothetical protein PHR56_08655 [Dehalococcoidales bacterium]|nr:hypothetical protein [Dehalococcoidales bacterium]
MSDALTFPFEWEIPIYMKIMPKFYDRYEASQYFHIKAEDFKDDLDHQVWYARASLNEFKSALDVIGTDMKAIGLDKQWRASEENRQLMDHLIIKMISHCRGLSFHTGKVDIRTKERMLRVIGHEESRLSTFKTLFIDGMREQLNNTRLKLTQDEKSEIEEIEDGIPLFIIIAKCYKITHLSLEKFLLDNGRLDTTASKKFWETLSY